MASAPDVVEPLVWLESGRRWLLVTIVPLTGVLVWTGTAEPFQLPKATLLVVVALLLVALEVARSVLGRQVEVPRGAAAVLAASFLLCAVVTTLVAPTPIASLVGGYGLSAGLSSYLAYGVLFASVVLALRSLEDVVRFLKAAAVGLLLVAGYGVLQALGIEPLTFRSEVTAPVFATMGNANFAAGWVGLMLPAGLWLAVDRRRAPWWRSVGAAAATGAVVVAVASGSFQGPVTVAASGAAFAVFSGLGRGGFLAHRRRTAAVSAAAVAALVVILAVTPLGGPIQDEVADGLVERPLFWEAAIGAGIDRPLLGTGLDSFPNEFFAHRPAEHAVRYGFANAQAPHSVPLAMLVGGGVPLLLLYLGFVGVVGATLLRGLVSLDEEARLPFAAVGAAWVGYQVQSTVSFDMPALAASHWVLAGVIVALAGRRPRSFGLPGAAAVVRGKGRRRQLVVPSSSWVALTVISVVFLAALVPVTRPLRADLEMRRTADSASTGDAELVRSGFERVHRLAPWQGRYWAARSAFEEQAGDPDAALAAAVEAARLDPGEVADLRRAALLAVQLGQVERAHGLYEEAMRRDPRNPTLKEEAAALLLDDGQQERAQPLAAEAEHLRRGAS